MTAQVFLQDAAVLQDKFGKTCSVYTAAEIFAHPEWTPFKEKVSVREERARLRAAFALQHRLTLQLQVLAHVAAARLHATELSSIAATENRALGAIAASLQAVLGTVNELQAAGRATASAAAVEKVQEMLSDMNTRISAAATMLAGGDPAVALGRSDGRCDPAQPSLLAAAAAAAAGAATAATMPAVRRPFITLEALGSVARLVQEWTVGLGTSPLMLYDADTTRRAAAAAQAGITAKVHPRAAPMHCAAVVALFRVVPGH